MPASERYKDALNQIPPPGGGCHTSLLGAANYGVRAGLPEEQIFQDLRESIPRGNRHVPDKEIWDAINKARTDRSGTPLPAKTRPKPFVTDGEAALRKILSQGRFSADDELRAVSPVPIYDEPLVDLASFLLVVCKPEDLIWMGERQDPGVPGRTIRDLRDWMRNFDAGGTTEPHIILNPLTGQPAEKKSGGITLRGDGNVSEYRYCLVEFDKLSRDDQIRFWSAVKLPLVALIDSGGKSIHAWLDVQKLAKVATPEEWQSEIKGRLYDRLLIPMGVDGACSNPARLSRLPGHFREDTGRFQRLLWLSPEGRSIC